MRKLLTFLIALGAVAFGVCSPASSQGLMTLGAGSVKGVVVAASNWCGLIPQSGLVNCWPYDTANTTTSTATDVVGGKNSTQLNVTLNGSGPSANLNNAAVFNGTTSHGDTPGPASSTPPPRAAFSVVYWVFPQAVGAFGSVIANDNSGGADNNGIRFFYQGGTATIHQFAGNGTTSADLATAVTFNAWTMQTVTYDGTTLISYLNSTAVSTLALAGPIATPTNALGFGYDPAAGGWIFSKAKSRVWRFTIAPSPPAKLQQSTACM
jgi:hypothetical protein